MEESSVIRDEATKKAMFAIDNAVSHALPADRPAALSAMADCARALLRIAARAATLPADMEHFEIRQNRGPTIEFQGVELASEEHETKGRDAMRISMEIYRTRGGAMVAVSSMIPIDREGFEDVRATVVEPSEDEQAMRFAVMDAFNWDQRARKMVTKKLGWSLRMDVE